MSKIESRNTAGGEIGRLFSAQRECRYSTKTSIFHVLIAKFVKHRRLLLSHQNASTSCVNAGQLCFALDHVRVHRSVANALIEQLRAAVRKIFFFECTMLPFDGVVGRHHGTYCFQELSHERSIYVPA